MLTEPETAASAPTRRSSPSLGDHLVALLDAVAEGVTVQDASGALVHANEAAATLVGFASGKELVEADGATILGKFELYDEAGARVSLTDLPGRLVLAGEPAPDRLVRFHLLDGQAERWALVRARPMRGPNGERWAVNTFREITDERSAQLASIFNGITDPFSVLDRDLRITYVNESGARLIGKAQADIIGKRAWDLAPEVKDGPLHKAYERVLKTRKTLSIEQYYPRWDRWFESTIYPILDGIAVYTRDVTVRKSAMELTRRMGTHAALRADVSGILSDERDIVTMLRRTCESLVEHLDVAFARVWALDESGETLILQASAGMYTHTDGGHRAVPVGKFKIGRIAQYKRPHISNDVQHDPEVGNPEWAAREKMVAFAGYPLVVDGNLVGVIAMFAQHTLPEDTTSSLQTIADLVAQGLVRRRTEIELQHRLEDLARSNSELEQFAYVASHDLQEPLRMVASYNQLLARRYKGKLGTDADEFIGFTVEGVTRMQRLINDLLAYSRVGTRFSERIEVDLQKVYEITIGNLQRAIHDAGATVTCTNLPWVLADEGQMIQLLQNLIGNAIKFHGDDPPKVEIGQRPDGAFYVKDNGIGIDPQFFDRIFVIFQRLNPREKYPGTGIGLAICKKIVERHAGKIWVESTPGRGSTVLFTLGPTRKAAT